MRAGQPGVHALGEFRVDRTGQRPQPCGVGVDHVDELRPDQRRPRGQIQMIADQHRLAHGEVLAHRAGGVGQHDHPGAGRAGCPHRVHDVLQVVTFVGVRTSSR